ncbi:hypothetical protein DLD77_03125 [Chitinophaga alhagiae]|uniref:Uncharacterized protein n=1 Tax=Chitinophaga alhagiae TaxID=2203219 RepID=A0ABN5LSP6_9BACT|nr:hypothetical protein [Chitinophaga alhagiae]AWO00760.1 hypothetical protein DLD77_03125 [Chitinophaga alhagiae]
MQPAQAPAPVTQLAPAAISGSFSPVMQAFRNPGALAGLRHFSAGLYTERGFLLKELSVYAVALSMPVATGVVGVKLWQFGFPLYREQLAGLGYALALGNRLQAAVFLDYGTYGMDAELGLVWQLTKETGLSLHLWGPGRRHGVYTAGLSYMPSTGLRLEGEWRKEANWPLFMKVQCLYRPTGAVWLLAGFSTAPATQFAGAAFKAGRLQIGVTGSYHSLLGITPGIMLVWGKE